MSGLVAKTSTRTIRRIRCVALAPLSGNAHAFLPHLLWRFHHPTCLPARPRRDSWRSFSSNSLLRRVGPRHESRRFFSSNSLIRRVGEAARSLLPAKWLESAEERASRRERRRAQEEIAGGIRSVLENAPLPLRMLGKVVAPLVSRAFVGLAEAAKEDEQRMRALFEQAAHLLAGDDAAREVLGDAIEIGRPFSRSSSRVSVNGVDREDVRASFEVVGSRGGGVVSMVADGDGIRRLRLEAAGRSVEVSLDDSAGVSLRSSQSKSRSKGGFIDANIIDAEYEEKK